MKTNDDAYGGFIVSNYRIAPVMLALFDAPYGTDLCWMYEKIPLWDFTIWQKTATPPWTRS